MDGNSGRPGDADGAEAALPLGGTVAGHVLLSRLWAVCRAAVEDRAARVAVVIVDENDARARRRSAGAREHLAVQERDGLPGGAARPLALALHASSRRPFWQLLQGHFWIGQAGEVREIASMSAAEVVAAIAESRRSALSLKLSLTIELQAEVLRLRHVDQRPNDAQQLAGEALGVALADPDDLLERMPLMDALRRRLAQAGHGRGEERRVGRARR